MTTFEVWIPAGEAVLRNTETGEEMRLTSDSGPLSLGCVELAWLPGLGAPAAAASRRPEPAPASSAAAEPDAGSAAAAAPEQQAVPGAALHETELPFLSPAEPIMPQPPREFDRTLDAPLDALTREDFELMLETLARGRNEVEGELEFLQDIEAEPETVAAMEEELERIDAKFAAVSARLTAWETLQRRRDEAMGLEAGSSG